MAETRFTRRDLIRASAVGGAATLIGKAASAQVVCADQTPIPISELAFTTCGAGPEPMATSPFIVAPFKDPLPIPQAMRPGWRYPNATLATATDPNSWPCRKSQFGPGVVR